MKPLNIYFAYLDDGKDTYKIVVPAENKKEVENYVAGNGEIIAIKEDKEYSIHTDHLADVLRKNGYGQVEIDIIIRTLTRSGVDYDYRKSIGKAWSV